MLLTLATRCFTGRDVPGPAGTTLEAGREAVIGLPRFAIEELELRGLSVSAGMLGGWGVPDLEALRDAADKAGCPCLVLIEDEPLGFGETDVRARDAATDRLARLGAAAHRLGCSSVAIHVAGPDDERAFDRAAVAVKDAMPGLDLGEVDALGGDPGVGEHATAKLHRWWMDAKASASKDEDKAMLDEVLRGEKRAADAYQDALESNLEDNLHRLVEEQYRGVTEARREVEQLLETL